MLSNTQWTELIDGIVFRQVVTDQLVWQYAIPSLAQGWVGPYATEELARRQALLQVLQTAGLPVVVGGAVGLTLERGQLDPTPTIAVEQLRQRITQLLRADAVLGFPYKAYLHPLVAQAQQAYVAMRAATDPPS